MLITILALSAFAQQVDNGTFDTDLSSWSASDVTWEVTSGAPSGLGFARLQAPEDGTATLESTPFLITTDELSWYARDDGYELELFEVAGASLVLVSDNPPNGTFTLDALDTSAWCGTLATVTFRNLDEAVTDIDDVALTGTPCPDYTDTDTDNWCAYGVDLNLDGDCADVGEPTATVQDCAVDDPTRYPGASEAPADGVDSDCDGEELCYVDGDGDGYGEAATSGSPQLDCLAPGFADNPDDICPKGDDDLDGDGDTVPDACDQCPGDDSADDDGDGVCDGNDLCEGDDSTTDSDGDGWCDDVDLCEGDDLSGDSDGDGTCDDEDLTPYGTTTNTTDTGGGTPGTGTGGTTTGTGGTTTGTGGTTTNGTGGTQTYPPTPPTTGTSGTSNTGDNVPTTVDDDNKAAAGCGCQATGSVGWLALWPSLLWLRRRR